MFASYFSYLPHQQRLVPDALQDLLPQAHLENFISVSADSLNLSAASRCYAKGGPRNQPFNPEMNRPAFRGGLLV